MLHLYELVWKLNSKLTETQLEKLAKVNLLIKKLKEIKRGAEYLTICMLWCTGEGVHFQSQ